MLKKKMQAQEFSQKKKNKKQNRHANKKAAS